MPYKDPEVAKARSAFYRSQNREKLRASARKRHFDKRDEHLAYLKKYRTDNLEARINNDLQNRYGITLEVYKSILESQNGVCSICSDPPKPSLRLSVDHDHDSGKIRGLLCNRCNLGLGYFKDSPNFLNRALSYLARHGKKFLE